MGDRKTEMENDRNKDRDIEREREKDSHKDEVETEQTFGERKKDDGCEWQDQPKRRQRDRQVGSNRFTK